MKLALIGAGRWGTNIQRTLKGIGGVELVVLDKGDDLDPTSPRLRGASGVLVATPGSTHARVALPFIERGLPTFIEKPLTTSLDDALRLEKAARQAGGRKPLVFVGHIHLYNPAFLKAKSLIAEAGVVRSLMFEGMNNGPYRDDMSALWDWTPHDVSMAIDVMGSMPQSVQAWGQKLLRPKTDLYDTVLVRLDFPPDPTSPRLRGASKGGEGGLISAIIHNSWLSPEKRKKMTVVCERDSIVYDDVKPEEKVVLYKGMGPFFAKASPFAKATEDKSKGKPRSIQHQDPVISYPRYDKVSPLEAEMRAFLEVVKTNKPAVTGLQNGLDVIRVLDAAERSIGLDGKAITL